MEHLCNTSERKNVNETHKNLKICILKIIIIMRQLKVADKHFFTRWGITNNLVSPMEAKVSPDSAKQV